MKLALSPLAILAGASICGAPRAHQRRHRRRCATFGLACSALLPL